MTDLFRLSPPDDPTPCLDAAARLRALARAAEAAGDHLDGQAALPSDVFSGVAARAYRAASSDLRDDARLLAADARGLAASLVQLVDDLLELQRRLEHIRQRAIAARLEVVGDEIHLPECPTTVETQAFWTLLELKNRVHSAAWQSQRAWEAALARHTDGVGRLPAPVSDSALAPPSPASPPAPAPPAPAPPARTDPPAPPYVPSEPGCTPSADLPHGDARHPRPPVLTWAPIEPDGVPVPIAEAVPVPVAREGVLT